ncbi:hypothetical protein [Acidovorax sp. Root217]|uniref:hypothetical protein n=1 Tax=Acidovorax sp. Root217 TaxID=1736492 RepID=UPI0012FCA086|nr:hypothetical protein [Acidovorax sp. Root217]
MFKLQLARRTLRADMTLTRAPMAAKKSTVSKPAAKPKKSPHQLAQWAAYEALCAQREHEAKARQSVVDAQVATAKVAADKLAAIESLRLGASMFHEAEQLRKLADAVLERLDPHAPVEVMTQATRWRARVFELAEGIDPTEEILAGFAKSAETTKPAEAGS